MAGLYLDPMKFGPPGEEMELSQANWAIPERTFAQSMARLSAELKTVEAQALSDVLAEFDPSFTLLLDSANPDTRDAIQGIYIVADTQLAFVFADDWRIPSQRYVMEATGTTFTMRDSPFHRLDKAYDDKSLGQILTQSKMGVFTDRKWRDDHGTPNLFSAYNRQTRQVTLSSSQSVGTVLYMDWYYRGLLCRIRRAPSSVNNVRQPALFAIRLDLEAA